MFCIIAGLIYNTCSTDIHYCQLLASPILHRDKPAVRLGCIVQFCAILIFPASAGSNISLCNIHKWYGSTYTHLPCKIAADCSGSFLLIPTTLFSIASRLLYKCQKSYVWVNIHIDMRRCCHCHENMIGLLFHHHHHHHHAQCVCINTVVCYVLAQGLRCPPHMVVAMQAVKSRANCRIQTAGC